MTTPNASVAMTSGQRRAEPVPASEPVRLAAVGGANGEDIKTGLADILEAMNDLVGMADSEGTLSYLNGAGRKLLGFKDGAELNQTTLADCQAASARNLFIREVMPAALRDGSWSGESALVSRDGKVIPVRQTILARKDAVGNLLSLAIIARDVSERRHAEEEHQQLLQEYRTMFDAVPALIWYKDRDNRILRVNRPAAETLGMTSADLEGKSTFDLYPDDAEKYYRDDREVIESGQPKLGIMEQVVTRTGEKLWVQTDKVPYRNEHGEVIGVIVLARDISARQKAEDEVRQLNADLERRVRVRTAQLERANERLHAENVERRRAEEALAQRAAELDEANKKLIEAERIKSEFFANVSHELRTPLTLAMAPLESVLAGECGPLAESQSGVLKTVYNNVIRLLQMVTGLLDFSRFEAGKFEPHPEAVDIVALTEAIVADFAPMIRRKALTSRFDADVPAALVMLDRYLYERVLFNLLSNAIKFTLAGGQIWVALHLLGDRLRLDVRDTGIGIAEADVPRLFQKFRQLEGSATRRFEGSGLGLALVKEFAGLLGGTVTVVSKPGAGSTFTLECQAAHVEAPVNDISSSQPRGPRIRTYAPVLEAEPTQAEDTTLPKLVIAEDNPELATYIASLLRDRCQIKIAGDGEEALAIIHAWLPDLVLSDVMMPRRDGLSLCRELKANPETARIPVVLLTAMTHRESLLQGWEAGADEYLFKPFHSHELVTRVRTLLESSLQRRRAEVELHRTAEALTRSNQELELFASVASHDLQEPLRMVASYMELLKQRYQGHLDEKANRWIHFAVDGVVRMKQLINDLLEYSHVATKGKPFAPTDCEQVLRTVLQNLQQAIQESGAIVRSGPMPTVMADTTQLTEVFQNLIGNAVKYRSDKPPEVDVEAQHEPDGWVFKVRDNGIGIDSAYFERIFVIFQRLHTRQEYPGTGIGLTVCKKIVERHGGRIWVESQLGQGATFCFTIPDREMEPHAHATNPEAKP